MAEDTALVLAMRRAGLRFVFEPRAMVRCWTAADLREAFGMYRRYAYSDGQAAHLGVPQTRYGRVYAIYAGGAVLLVLGFGWPVLWILLVAGGLAILARLVARSNRAILLECGTRQELALFARRASSSYEAGSAGRTQPRARP